MKHIFNGLIAFLLLISLTGCAETTNQGKEETTTIKQEELSVKEEESNKSTEGTDEKEQERAVNSSEESKEDDKEQVADSLNTFDASVVRVVDGDTIKVDIGGSEESVRFLLVDTPETSHPQLGKQPFGEEAKAFVQEMLEGKTVQLEKDVSDRDKYNRLLYYIYVDGVSVQEELLRNGLARVAYVYAPNTKHVDKYYALQKEAQEKAIGIWSVENYATDDGFNKEVIEGTQEKPVDTSSENEEGSADCTIKGNISSSGEKIYHLPGQQFYEKTIIEPSKGESFFCSREEAESAGFRASQR